LLATAIPSLLVRLTYPSYLLTRVPLLAQSWWWRVTLKCSIYI